MQPWFLIVFVDVILSFGLTIDVSIAISRIHWIRWNRGRWNRGRWFHLATRFANDELKGLRIISVTPSTCKHSTCCSCSVVFSRSRKESVLWHFPRGLGLSSWVGNNQSSTPLLPVRKKTKCVATVLDKDEPYCAWTEKNPQVLPRIPLCFTRALGDLGGIFAQVNWGSWRPLFSAFQGMNFGFSAASSLVNWRTPSTQGEG